MNPEAFTKQPEVARLIDKLQQDCSARHYSDIIDARPNQYVDLVMAGGGLLGIAIVGYVYALEAIGIRFLRIGGTSAGSITALLLAALGTSDQPKADTLVEILSAMDTWSFVDGGPAAQRVVRDYLDQRYWFECGFDWTRVAPRVWTRRGLNPGDQFRAWLSGVMHARGITTTAQLRDRIRQLPSLLKRQSGETLSIDDLDPRVALIAADITTETKVELPRMACLYWSNWQQMDPAIYVRASMSIPFFFEPLIVEDIPRGGDAAQLWSELAKYRGVIPARCAFVDGGIMSNFPIGIFHSYERVPTAPTFGIALGSRERTVNRVDSVWRLGVAIFDSARHCLDYDFIGQNPDYENLVGYIDTDGFDWLDFDMSDQHKIDLFLRGVRAAYDFLHTFDWEKYKRIRAHLAEAHKP